MILIQFESGKFVKLFCIARHKAARREAFFIFPLHFVSRSSVSPHVLRRSLYPPTNYNGNQGNQVEKFLFFGSARDTLALSSRLLSDFHFILNDKHWARARAREAEIRKGNFSNYHSSRLAFTFAFGSVWIEAHSHTPDNGVRGRRERNYCKYFIPAS